VNHSWTVEEHVETLITVLLSKVTVTCEHGEKFVWSQKHINSFYTNVPPQHIQRPTVHLSCSYKRRRIWVHDVNLTRW